MILQAYDFYQLFKSKNCILQVGGSDQWGNIVNGVDLYQKGFAQRVIRINIPVDYISFRNKNGKN